MSVKITQIYASNSLSLDSAIYYWSIETIAYELLDGPGARDAAEAGELAVLAHDDEAGEQQQHGAQHRQPDAHRQHHQHARAALIRKLLFIKSHFCVSGGFCS